MELAKVTAKGQITIPIEIRRKLGVKDGDKVLFIEEAGRIYITNAAVNSLVQFETIFTGNTNRTTDVALERDSINVVGDVIND